MDVNIEAYNLEEFVLDPNLHAKELKLCLRDLV